VAAPRHHCGNSALRAFVTAQWQWIFRQAERLHRLHCDSFFQPVQMPKSFALCNLSARPKKEIGCMLSFFGWLNVRTFLVN